MGLRLKYEDIPCSSTTDMRKAVLECARKGTKNLYVIVNYSGLYRTNHLLSELEKESGAPMPGGTDADGMDTDGIAAEGIDADGLDADGIEADRRDADQEGGTQA